MCIEQPNLWKEIHTTEVLETSESSVKGLTLQMQFQEEKRQCDTSNLLDEILSRSNMFEALKRVRSNKGSAGIDGMSTVELGEYLKTHWLEIRHEITEGKYKPSPIRKVEIPKEDGSKRMLGIPTVLDRLIQQAISQRLLSLYDGVFSENSYGFRPGRNTHQAVRQAKLYIEQGYDYVVDLDIEKFFDRVNHDYLMSRIAVTIKDKKLLLLIRRNLQAGIMENGVLIQRTEGTPQGSPLSPVLSNILLDELDKELDKRGHRYVRYADDCTIYVNTERAGERVKESIGRFISKKLKLKLNETKSGVRRPDEIKILGFSFYRKRNGEWKIRISKKAKEKLKKKVANITKRSHTVSISIVIDALNLLLTGWGNYFKLTEIKGELSDLDGWIRNRLRIKLWHNWSRVRTKFRELKRLGVSFLNAIRWSKSRKGAARIARSPILLTTLTKDYFRKLGYKELALIN